MLLDDLAQYWGHAQGLPGLRIGMTSNEASAAIPADVQRSTHGGELHFAVGDPLQREGTVALRCAIKRWREIRIDATKQWDDDGSFWSGASLVTEYVAICCAGGARDTRPSKGSAFSASCIEGSRGRRACSRSGSRGARLRTSRPS